MHEPPKRDSSTLRPIESEIESRPTVSVRASDIAKLAAQDDERSWVPGFLRDPLIIILLLVLLSAATIFFWPRFLWKQMPTPADKVVLVDYTVPFVSAREHRGATWLLNHGKYAAPDGESWKTLGSYVGYDPVSRGEPTRIATQDLSQVDWLFVVDAYGVYEDDLRDPTNERAHMDRSKMLFGGISDADADAIAAFSDRGGHTLLEFNSLEDPTSPAARRMIEERFGIHWTGWIGRTFQQLRDTLDVPYWLPRLHRQHYGDRPMPMGPTLMLVHTDGRLLLIPGISLGDAGPHLQITAKGERVLDGATGGAEYGFWFPVLTANAGTEVLAELVLPENPKLMEILAREGLTNVIPALTRRIGTSGAHHVYLATDLSDSPYEPGRYDLLGPKWMRAIADFQPDIYVGLDAFWSFYVPAVSSILKSPR